MNKPNIQLTLRRFLHTRYGMEGTLSMHAHHVCHTVEHPIHHLPPGDYKVILLTHPHLRRKVPCLLPLKSDTNQVHSPIGHTFIGIGNGPYRLTDGSIIVGPGRHFCNFCPADCSVLPQKVKKVKGKKVKSSYLQCAMLFLPVTEV